MGTCTCKLVVVAEGICICKPVVAVVEGTCICKLVVVVVEGTCKRMVSSEVVEEEVICTHSASLVVVICIRIAS